MKYKENNKFHFFPPFALMVKRGLYYYSTILPPYLDNNLCIIYGRDLVLFSFPFFLFFKRKIQRFSLFLFCGSFLGYILRLIDEGKREYFSFYSEKILNCAGIEFSLNFCFKNDEIERDQSS